MAFNKDIPTSSTSLKASNPQILANQSQVQEALSFDHQFEGTDPATQTGKHEKVTLIEIADLGTGSDGLTLLGAQIVNVKPELVYVDEDDNDIQLTSAGKSGSATTDLLANDATVGGTLGVTGVATLGDGSLLATSAAPTTDAMITNKKFVNDIVGTEADGQTAGPTTTGFQFFAINGVSTKVYTKFLTGNLLGGTTEAIAHEVDDFDNILSVSATFFNPTDNWYGVEDYRASNFNGAVSFLVRYDATNINVVLIGSQLQNTNVKYRIKIEYTA